MADPGEPIYDTLLAERYDQRDATRRYPTPSGGTPVDIAQFEADVKAHFEGLVDRAKQDVTDGEAWLAEKIPGALTMLQQIQGSTLGAAFLAATHVPTSVLDAIAATLTELEDKFAATAAPAADTTDEPEAPAEPADEQPAAPADDATPAEDDVPADPAPAAPAPGPVIAGTAR